MLGRICVRDKRSKRIDGFFASNPELAGDYLDHLYFEVRALAAKYANPFQIARLMNDREPRSAPWRRCACRLRASGR